MWVMGYKTYLSGIFFGTLCSMAAFVLVLLTLNPEKGLFSLIAFFASLFFLIFGLASLGGFYGRKLIFGNEILYANVGIAARQGLFVAGFIVANLVLKAYDILVWWDTVLLLASFILMELFFRARD